MLYTNISKIAEVIELWLWKYLSISRDEGTLLNFPLKIFERRDFIPRRKDIIGYSTCKQLACKFNYIAGFDGAIHHVFLGSPQRNSTCILAGCTCKRGLRSKMRRMHRYQKVNCAEYKNSYVEWNKIF